MRGQHCKFLSFLLCLSFVIVVLYPGAASAERCEQWVAKVVSVQGSVEAKKAGEARWQPVELNDTYCPGDEIRAGENSRANLALINDWGTVDLFLLPYFRERTFPGINGRLRSQPRVDSDQALYESSDKEKHLDYAVKLIGAENVGIGTDESGMGYWSDPDEFKSFLKPDKFLPNKKEDGSPQVKDTERYWRYDHEPESMAWSNWPYFSAVGMVCRGYSDDVIRGIIGGNFLRFAGPILDRRPRGILI